ncbi:hypothetical protein BU15DRAFT_44922 [Melanogaster broomeanus]|nr:hypothetical protein BU15DRAFT_44922 [Melanogaster broomeanus]
MPSAQQRIFIPFAAATVVNSGISIPLGIFIGFLASFVQSLGLAIQRRSHVLNSLLPEPERKVEHRRPLWLLGFAIFLGSNIFGSLVQIASLPVVILAPLGAVSLLWNALFAGLLFRPPLVLGTALIAGGAALIAVYGIVPETPRSLDELMTLFARPAFIAWFCVEGAVVLVCLIVTHAAEYSFTRRLEVASHALLQANGEFSESSLCASPELSPCLSPTSIPPVNQHSSVLSTGCTDAHERTPLLDPKPASLPPVFHKSRPSSLYSTTSTSAAVPTPLPRISGRTPLLLALAYAAASGTLSGLGLIFAKSGVELLVVTIRGSNQFYRWEAWALVIGLVGFALGQMWYLNRGLRLADPAFVCPSAFCFYNFSSILNGLVYFNQLSELSGLHIGLVVLGMIILLAGVWAVSAQAGIDNSYPDEQDGSEASITEVITDATTVVPAMEIGPDVAIDATWESLSPTKTHTFSLRNSSPQLSPSKSGSKNKAESDRGIGTLGPEASMSMHTLHPTPTPTASPPLRSPLTLPRVSSQRTPAHVHSELLSPGLTRSSRRPHVTLLDHHLLPHPGSSIRTMSSSVSGGVMEQGLSPTGLTIGLSPVSPGFGFGVGPGGAPVGGQGQRRSRRMSGMSGMGLGLSFSDVVENVQGGGGLRVEERRRAVSEGDVRRQRRDGETSDEQGTEGAGVAAPEVHRDVEVSMDSSVYPPTAGLRWKWLRKALTRGSELGR